MQEIPGLQGHEEHMTRWTGGKTRKGWAGEAPGALWRPLRPHFKVLQELLELG